MPFMLCFVCGQCCTRRDCRSTIPPTQLSWSQSMKEATTKRKRILIGRRSVARIESRNKSLK